MHQCIHSHFAANVWVFCRFDPLWNSLVVGGLEDGKPFLGTIGMIGTHYTDGHVATGTSNRLAYN